jgi:hypothetical protein
LQGRHLSSVQEFGLQILHIADAREKRNDFDERLKIALVGHDPAYFIPRVFKELAEPAKVREARVEDLELVEVPMAPDEDLSDTEGMWRFTGDVTQEEAERIMRSFSPQGTLSASDIDSWAEDWDDETVPG